MASKHQEAVRTEVERRIEKLIRWGGCPTSYVPAAWLARMTADVGAFAEAVNETCFPNPAHPERGGADKCQAMAVQVAAISILCAAYANRAKCVGAKDLGVALPIAWTSVQAERKRQVGLWGEQDGNTLWQWVSILTEELGESAVLVVGLEGRTSPWWHSDVAQRLYTEIIQCAAVAVAIAEGLEKQMHHDCAEAQTAEEGTDINA